MSTINIKAERKKIYRELNVLFARMITHTEKYMSSFQTKDFFLFSGKDERREQYKKAFLLFRAELFAEMVVSDQLISNASSLFIKADREMAFEDVALLQTLLEEYERFVKAFTDHTSFFEKNYKANELSPSSLLDSAERIRLLISRLLIKTNNTEA